MPDISYLIIILCLLGLNFFTIWFYQKQIATLVDKAMSKSYHEYVQTKNLEQGDNFPKVITQEKESISDPVLDELNRTLL